MAWAFENGWPHKGAFRDLDDNTRVLCSLAGFAVTGVFVGIANIALRPSHPVQHIDAVLVGEEEDMEETIKAPKKRRRPKKMGKKAMLGGGSTSLVDIEGFIPKHGIVASMEGNPTRPASMDGPSQSSIAMPIRHSSDTQFEADLDDPRLRPVIEKEFHVVGQRNKKSKTIKHIEPKNPAAKVDVAAKKIKPVITGRLSSPTNVPLQETLPESVAWAVFGEPEVTNFKKAASGTQESSPSSAIVPVQETLPESVEWDFDEPEVAIEVNSPRKPVSNPGSISAAAIVPKKVTLSEVVTREEPKSNFKVTHSGMAVPGSSSPSNVSENKAISHAVKPKPIWGGRVGPVKPKFEPRVDLDKQNFPSIGEEVQDASIKANENVVIEKGDSESLIPEEEGEGEDVQETDATSTVIMAPEVPQPSDDEELLGPACDAEGSVPIQQGDQDSPRPEQGAQDVTETEISLACSSMLNEPPQEGDSAPLIDDNGSTGVVADDSPTSNVSLQDTDQDSSGMEGHEEEAKDAAMEKTDANASTDSPAVVIAPLQEGDLDTRVPDQDTSKDAEVDNDTEKGKVADPQIAPDIFNWADECDSD